MTADGVVRYVGKGCEKRCLCHMGRKEFSSLQDLDISVKYHLTEKDALIEEALLIKKHESKHLVNIAGRTVNAVKKRTVLREPVVLTDKLVEDLPFNSESQSVVRDEVCRGLFVVVGKRTKSYTVQTDLRKSKKRQTIKIALGRHSDLTVEEARKKAEAILVFVRRRQDPRQFETLHSEAA
jgi:Arm DNA-binding domain